MRRVSLITAVGLLLSVPAHTCLGGANNGQLKGICVSPDVDDNADGSPENPWQSIQKALDVAQPGTFIYLKGGTYRQKLHLTRSGSEGAPITIKAYDSLPPVIDGGNGRGVLDNPELAGNIRSMNAFLEMAKKLPRFNSDDGILKVSGSWIVIDGIHLTGSPSSGMYFHSGASHIVVKNCDVSHCVAPGICVGAENSPSSDVKVLHNHIFNCSQRSRESISLRTVDGFEVAYNKVEFVIKESIDAKSGCTNGTIHHNHVLNSGHCGIYLDAGYPDRPKEQNIDIYDNIVENAFGTAICVAAEAGNSISGVRIYNNLVWTTREDNRGCGIKVSLNSSNTDGWIEDIMIYNNTVYGFKQQGIYVNYPKVRNIRICNNISANTMSAITLKPKVVDPKQVVIDRNLVWGTVLDPGRGAIQADPMFKNVAEGDFTLQEGSPAIDVAYKKFVPSDDITGQPRPQGRGYDLGAYEYKKSK